MFEPGAFLEVADREFDDSVVAVELIGSDSIEGDVGDERVVSPLGEQLGLAAGEGLRRGCLRVDGVVPVAVRFMSFEWHRGEFLACDSPTPVARPSGVSGQRGTVGWVVLGVEGLAGGGGPFEMAGHFGGFHMPAVRVGEAVMASA